jgi:hypothetical protein
VSVTPQSYPLGIINFEVSIRNSTDPPVAAPEPGSLLLLVGGAPVLGGVLLARRKRLPAA